MTSLSKSFATLPAPVRQRLAIGSSGVLHLLDCARVACTLPGVSPQCSSQIALSALAESPLSGELTRQALAFPGITDTLGAQKTKALQALVQHWKRPDNLSYFQRLAERRDTEKLLTFVDRQVAEQPNNLFWREQAVSFALFDGNTDAAFTALDIDVPQALEPVLASARYQAAFLAQDWQRAVDLAQAMAPLYGEEIANARAAEAHLQAGHRNKGIELLLSSLRNAPWRTTDVLRAVDLIQEIDNATAPLTGAVTILLYTWNKADDLDDALASLAASDLGLARILALNNGSTDHTAKILAKWQHELGRDRLLITELPINIGAPAARNWLMHSPEAMDADWIVYLDDDAVVSTDWLVKLGAAVQAYPDAGVWGCRVIDDHQPTLIQAVDLHLPPAEGEPPLGPDLASLSPNPFKLSNLHVQGLDRGQFNYLRPCASVTGCCHLFSADRLREIGDFSLFLSPSQYDDVEHDLRMVAKGRLAVYQGHLAVRHKKRTGRAGLAPGSENANAMGNRYKMQVMHDATEIHSSSIREQELLQSDLLKKYIRLGEEIQK